MFLPRRYVALVVLAVAAGVGALAPVEADAPPAVASAVKAAASIDAPWPIARVRVSEAQLGAALKAFDAGTLVRLPRTEFEARLRNATLAAADARAVPRLIEAKYRARLVAGNLSGDAEWTIHNPRPHAAALPLDPLRIAVHSPVWADGSGAVIGAFGPGFPAGPALWVPGGGRQTLKLKWS